MSQIIEVLKFGAVFQVTASQLSLWYTQDENACQKKTINQLHIYTGKRWWNTHDSDMPNEQVPHPHTHPFKGPLSGTTQVSQYQKGKTDLDFTEARDSEWQWHQLGRMQVCTSLQTDNHASTHHSVFLQAGCPSCCPTNSVKALKAQPDRKT